MQQRHMDPQVRVLLPVAPAAACQHPVGQFNRYRNANANPYRFKVPDGRAVTCNENRCSGQVNTIADALALPAILATAFGEGLVANAVDSVQRNEAADPVDFPEGAGEHYPRSVAGT